MFAIPFVLLLLFGAPQQPDDPTSQQSLEPGRGTYEAYRQAAIHINDLAGKIHSEADAQAFVDAVAEQESEHHYPLWTIPSLRHRVAHAEFQAVSDSSRLIPEQRIVDVWNEYVREINAPEEALITVAEVHNMRDGLHYVDRQLWKGQMQSLWTMPNVEAVGADGKVASGCRAVEALKIVYTMHELFQNLLSARDRVRRGALVSNLAAQRREQSAAPPARQAGILRASAAPNPARLAAFRYRQDHGEAAYGLLVMRLFDELFPTE